jgi:hypothetical protein
VKHKKILSADALLALTYWLEKHMAKKILVFLGAVPSRFIRPRHRFNEHSWRKIHAIFAGNLLSANFSRTK